MIRIAADQPRPLFNTAATRRIEHAAAATLPPHTLMQRAGLAVAQLAQALAPHARRVPGFPLDSLSVHLGTGRYYYDMPGYQSDDIALDNGFRRFFERVLAK